MTKLGKQIKNDGSTVWAIVPIKRIEQVKRIANQMKYGRKAPISIKYGKHHILMKYSY